jgi:4-amino-4-deoxy-L-arabinose transferase-like glycosyltransferase
MGRAIDLSEVVRRVSRTTTLRAVLGVVCLVGAAVAIVLWPQPAIGYGRIFWLWLASALGFAAAFPPAAEPYPKPTLTILLALLAIVIFAAALRLPEIEQIPANIAIDEVYPGLEALHIAKNGGFNVFSHLGWFNIPSLCFGYPAVVMKLLDGYGLYELRISSAIMGLAGLVVTFLLGRRWLGDIAALVAAFLMAAGFWHVHNSRTGFPFIQSSFAVPLVLYLIVRARQDRSLRVMAVAGLCLGVALQGYFPLRVLVVLVPILLVGMWMAARESPRRILIEGFAFTAAAAIVVGPLFRSVSLERLLERSYSILIFRSGVAEWLAEGYRATGTAPVLWQNLQESAGMFIDWADVCILNRSPGGLLDGVTLAAVATGSLVALMRGHRRALFLVFWAALVFLFGAALTDAPRASYRLAPAMPALFLIAGFGVRNVFFAEPPAHWWQRWLIWPALVSAFAVWVTYTNYQRFFVEYSMKGDGREFALAATLRLVGDQCDGRQFYWISGDQARQSDLFELFCPDFRALDDSAMPQALDRTRPATFIVMRPSPMTLARLKSCFPESRPVTVRAADRRYMFLRFDVSAASVAAARQSCAAEVVDDGAEQKPDPPRRRRPRPDPGFELD